MEHSRIKILANKVLAGEASKEEEQELETLYDNYDQKPDYTDELNQVQLNSYKELVYAGIAKRIDVQVIARPVQVKLWLRIAITAAALATIVFGLWFYSGNNAINRNAQIVTKNDIAPGKSIATLTLADGKSITLSEEKIGVIIGSKLEYNDGSRLEIDQKDDGSVGAVSSVTQQTLTATTPRGGTYQITLSDGTKVWLNADSKITFPSKFIKERREVRLEGEAYFEVTKSKSAPFIVECKGQEVEVLGTHFNINAYRDESSIKTSLLEGSVLVTRHSPTKMGALSAEDGVVLKPGEQANLKSSGISVSSVNVEDVVAWKDGNFVFNDEDFESIMRKVSRWYDMEIYYQDKPQKPSSLGIISRSKNLSTLLKVLELSGNVHFKVEGRRIIVMK
ncbi:fec operon regulator FecR [compost metagenome]